MRSTTAPVDLLAGAISWTHGALRTANSADPHTSTPCQGWDLSQLLAHMSDGLEAFTEASAGLVRVDRRPLVDDPVADLCTKACALLDAWTSSTTDWVRVHDVDLGSDVLLHAAALEIAVHGWDIAQACGLTDRFPDDLAEALLPAAMLLVSRPDRPGRFAPPLPTSYGDGPGERLLAQLGRRQPG